jgi:hypothetical protein
VFFRFQFPPTPSADAGAVAKDDAPQASVKMRTNGQLQARGSAAERLLMSNVYDAGTNFEVEPLQRAIHEQVGRGLSLLVVQGAQPLLLPSGWCRCFISFTHKMIALSAFSAGLSHRVQSTRPGRHGSSCKKSPGQCHCDGMERVREAAFAHACVNISFR